jgi:glycosyltransferase involved in cell wall biosynthesis
MRLAGTTPVVRISLGISAPERPLDPAGRPPPSLLFVGNFIHPPNVDAAARLIRDIHPQLHARYPEVVLHVVGEGPPEELRKMAGGGVEVTGRVPDVGPYLDRAAIIVVPLRQGGGMRVKVLEALAAGKPVVATPMAVEGLDVHDGEQVILARTDEEFVRVIGELLEHPQRRIALGGRARAWAVANLSWESVVAAYEALYASLLEAREVSLRSSGR